MKKNGNDNLEEDKKQREVLIIIAMMKLKL